MKYEKRVYNIHNLMPQRLTKALNAGLWAAISYIQHPGIRICYCYVFLKSKHTNYVQKGWRGMLIKSTNVMSHQGKGKLT